MKTLVIVSHPDLRQSGSQQFLKESAKLPGVTFHHLEQIYQDHHQTFPVKEEQAQIAAHDRLIFQFPFYWYSAPALFKEWLDTVFTTGFAYGPLSPSLRGKEIKLVVTAGVAAHEYQAGGREQFTLSEFLRPFQALAEKCACTYLPPLFISQFDYKTESQKYALLIEYQQALTLKAQATFKEQEDWFLAQFAVRARTNFSPEAQAKIALVETTLRENREELDDLNWALQEIREGEESE